MSQEPESVVLQLLRGIRAEVARLDAKIDQTRVELTAEFRSEINSLRADVASDMLVVRKETQDLISGLCKETLEQLSGLRRAVIEYNSSVVGHGILINEV